MEAKLANGLLVSPRIDSEKIARRIGTGGSVRFSRRFREQDRLQVLVSAQLQPKTRNSNRHKTVSLEVSCSYKNFPGISQTILSFTFKIHIYTHTHI